MMSFDPSSLRSVHRSERTAFRAVAGSGGVLLHLETGAYHEVNETGQVIWEAIGDGSTVGDLARGLIDRYGIDPAEATADVEEFVAALAERGFVVLG